MCALCCALNLPFRSTWKWHWHPPISSRLRRPHVLCCIVYYCHLRWQAKCIHVRLLLRNASVDLYVAVFFLCGEPTVIAECYTNRRHVEIKGPIVFSNHLFILQMEGKHTFGWDERWTHQTFDINENRVWVVYWILREWRMNMVWSWPWAHCINGRRTVCICICVCSMTHDMDLYGEVIRWHGNVSGVRT